MANFVLRSTGVFVALMTSGFACCGSGDVINAPPEGAPSRFADESDPSRDMFQVVHVVTEAGLRAGTPAGGPIVMSIWEPDGADMPYAVVDGVPMAWYRDPTAKPRNTNVPLADAPRFRTLIGGEASRTGATIILVRPPAAGADVQIGGFVVDDRASPLEFWPIPATYVAGRVVSKPASADSTDEEGRFWVQVPRGNYRGFLGGGVSTDGGRSVMGVVLGQERDAFSGDRGASLLVAQTVEQGRRMELKCTNDAVGN
ncbi:MAG: hypothetical protein H6818_17185 [Phycisphaerales bacterium]|nr:hypothetical protein [Phycisphaerales bacterium]